MEKHRAVTPPKRRVRFRVVFGDHLTARQLENMRPTLEGYCMNCLFFEEANSRSFVLETQREGGRKGLSKLLMDWEQLGFVRWEEISPDRLDNPEK
jgi:hypothetical protein